MFDAEALDQLELDALSGTSSEEPSDLASDASPSLSTSSLIERSYLDLEDSEGPQEQGDTDREERPETAVDRCTRAELDSEAAQSKLPASGLPDRRGTANAASTHSAADIDEARTAIGNFHVRLLIKQNQAVTLQAPALRGCPTQTSEFLYSSKHHCLLAYTSSSFFSVAKNLSRHRGSYAY